MSWPELEYSYGLHLKDIIHRCGFAKRDNAAGYVDSDVTPIIIEIGRYFRELDYSSRPDGFQIGALPDAVDPPMRIGPEKRARGSLYKSYTSDVIAKNLSKIGKVVKSLEWCLGQFRVKGAPVAQTVKQRCCIS